MKRLATLLLALFSLTTLLMPGMVLADVKGGKTINKAYIDEITEMAGGAKIDVVANMIRDGGLCLNLQEKTDYITTVLETPLDSADDTALYEANGGVIDNGDGTMTKRCARFTQIVLLNESGGIKEKKTDQYLIKKCPEEKDIPDGYGEQTSKGHQGNYYDCQEVTVIMSTLEQGGIGVLNVYVSLIYRWVAGIIGVVAVLIIVVSGIQIITAQGESSAIEEGKKRIIQSIGGIVLLFFASGLLYMINPTFFNPPEYEKTSETSTP